VSLQHVQQRGATQPSRPYEWLTALQVRSHPLARGWERSPGTVTQATQATQQTQGRSPATPLSRVRT